MYTVFCDGVCVHDNRVDALTLISPKVTLEENAAGSFQFTVTPKHPKYDIFQKMTSHIVVYDDDDELFHGRITEEKSDFYKRRTFYCEGELGYLKDSLQPPTEYHDISVRGFLEAMLAVHNEKTDADKHFEVGIVTVRDSNDSLYRYTNRETTLACINDKLIKRLGGHLRKRTENGTRYLDYLEDYPNTNTQIIKFGKNLLDFSKNFDMSDLCTVIVPLGARLDESPIAALEAYTTIESVNRGKEYLVSAAARTYGWIEKTVSWDDVTEPSNLLRKAQEYLAEQQFENMVLEVKGIDLHLLHADVEKIKLLDEIRVLSTPHGLDRRFPVTKLTIPLDHPAQATFTLGTNVKTSLTQSTGTIRREVNVQLNESILAAWSGIIKEAQDNASQMIHDATNGHVVTTADEQLIMDTADKQTARKVWRWNLNGFGYSKNGYNGDYKTAITMDGAIVADFITAGVLNANIIRAGILKDVNGNFYLDLEKGILRMNASEISLMGKSAATQQYVDRSISDAVGDLDDGLTQKEIFNRLTDNGNARGITLYKGQLYFSFDYAEGGTLTLGGRSNAYGVLEILDASKDVVCRADRNGVQIYDGSLRCSQGGQWASLEYGTLFGGQGDERYGYIDYSANSYNVNTGEEYHGIQMQGGMLRISTNVIAVSGTDNPNIDAQAGFTGEIPVLMGPDGKRWSTLHFINGICVGYWI